QNGLLPIVLEAGDAAAFADRVVAGNGAAPFMVDLRTPRIAGPGGGGVSFDIPAAARMRLLRGLGGNGRTLKPPPAVASWEERTAADQPWLQAAVDRRL